MTSSVIVRIVVAALLAGMVAVGVRSLPAAAVGCDTPGTPTTTVYLPNITKTLGGPTGWVTPFIVQNVGTTTTTLEVSFYGFADGSLVTCRKIAGILAGTSFADMPNNDADLPHNSQFSVVVRSFGSPVVSVVNEHQGQGTTAEALSYVGLSTGATRVALPYVAKDVGGWVTTFVLQNLGAADASVTASFVSSDGTKSATLPRRIGPGRSAFVNPLVEPALVTGTEYAVLLSADQPIGVVANAHNDAPGTPRPMGFSYNGVALDAAAAEYLPLVARNAEGRTSRLIVQNAGRVDATPSLSFRRLGGGAVLTVTAPQPVKPGRSWSFDPRFRADGTTACPPQGDPSCLAEGEHSAQISGGLFAPLNVLAGATTAMGYTAQAAAPSRVYLPNVTRTLGGATGWTTPIVVQSAGATAATLYWYRFADGSLAATQQLTGLAAGAATRVDPRTVPGLAENTQYAVVLDAPAPVTAIVIELNAEGGDGAMAYEGFPPPPGTVAGPIPTPTPRATATPTPTPTATRTPSATPSAPYPAGSFTLRGRVTSATTGAPLASVSVRAHPGGSSTYKTSIGSTRTDSEGIYSFTLPAGPYRIAFGWYISGSSRYASQYWGGAPIFETAADLELRQDRSGVDAALAPGYTISGRATTGGAPLVGASVFPYLGGAGACTTCSSLTGTSTGNDGAFTMVVAPGTYRMEVIPASGSNAVSEWWWSNSATRTAAADVVVAADVAGIDVPVPARAATTIEVSPASGQLIPGRTQQFTAIVKDQLGDAMSGQTVAWSVSPTNLGSISSTGLFTAAASASGTVTVTARVGAVSGTATLTPSGATVTVGGISFRYTAKATADAYIDTTVTEANAQTILVGVDADVAKVQTEFGRSFAARPSIYVFGTRQNALAGNESIFKMTAAKAANSAEVGGFFDTVSSTSVVVNWYNINDSVPVTTTRHELTHMMIQQIAGKSTKIPAWINEGTARLVQNTVPGAAWSADTNRYTAASAAAVAPSLLLPLADLVDQEAWNARTKPSSTFQYYEGSRAAQFVRDDVGLAGTIRIFELLSQGQSFDAAFHTVTGKSSASFAAAFPARLKASVASYPGVVTTTDTSGGPGLHFVAYGFSPSTTVSYRLAGPSTGSFTATTDQYGALRRYFTTAFNWLPGAYVVTVTESPTKSASATATLAAALSAEIRIAEHFDPTAAPSPLPGREDPPRPLE